MIHIALADPLGKRITDLLDALDQADEAVDNAEAKLGAAHDLMDKLDNNWQAQSAENRDRALSAIKNILTFDWKSLVEQGIKMGMSLDGSSSLTSNFDSAVFRVEVLILEMNTAIIRYYTTLGKVQNLIKEHNAGHADRGHTPWERHTVPSGPVEPWFVDDDLPDIPCKGGCGVTFPKPSAAQGDHLTKCGDGENVDDEARRRRKDFQGLNHEAIVDFILSDRSDTNGCGRDYYWCTQSEEHKTRFCNKQVSKGGTLQKCGEGYRNCMSLSAKHNGNSYKTSHDESTAEAPSTSPALAPSDSNYAASAGSTHTASISVPSGFNYVYWYIKSPSQSRLGTNVETDSGYGTSTSASFTWSVPSDASGEYVITAYTYLSDNSIVQPSYTVTVGQ